MTTSDGSAEIGTAQVKDLEKLRREVLDLARLADTATQRYERTVWIRYVAIFVPIPFAVLLFRLHMQYWHYYVAGALFLIAMLVIYLWDLAALEKCENATQAQLRAQEAHAAALATSRCAAKSATGNS